MFELEHDGIRKPAGEWGLAALSCTEAHAAEGSFLLGLAVDDARSYEIPFGYRDEVKIYRGDSDTPWFRGWVKGTMREGAPVAEGVAVELGDVWWYLDALPYLQVQKSLATPVGDPPDPPDGTAEVEITPTTADVYTSRVLLSAAADGSPVSVNAVLQAIVDYAAEEGVDIAVGDLPGRDVTVWSTSVRDQFCGDIIRDFLRWHPDVTCWVNHANGTLNFTGRAGAAVTTKALDGTDDVESWQVRPRPDLIPEAVAITYHVTDRSNEAEYLRVYEDIAPPDHSGRGPFVARASVELRGVEVHSQTQSIRTARIPGNSTVDPDSDEAFEWFARHIPQVARYTNAQIAVVDLVPELVVDTVPHPKDPLTRDARTLTTSVTLADLPNELVDGSLDDWGGGKAGTVKVTMKVGWAGGLVAFAALPQEEQDWFDRRSVGGVPYREVVVQVQATSRRSGSKERLTSISAPEPVPTGVAAHYLATRATLGYEGTVTLTADEVGATRLLGRVLNITGGQTAWATMRAQICQVQYDLVRGSTSVTFGPPPHLSLSDFSELGRMGRDNPPSATYRRDKPNVQRGTKSAGGYIQPRAETFVAPGGRLSIVRNATGDNPKWVVEVGDPAEPKPSYTIRRPVAASVSAGAPRVTITQDGETVEFGLADVPGISADTSNLNLNLRINQVEFELGGSGELTYVGQTVEHVLCWRDGLYIGTVDVGDLPLPHDTGLTIDDHTVSNVVFSYA